MVPKTTSASTSTSSKQGDLYQQMNELVVSRTPDQSQTVRYLHQVMRVAIAAISQEVGWNSAHLSTLDVLSDLTARYLLQLAKQTKKYTEHFGRTLVNEDDIALGLRDMNVSISGLEEYAQNFDPITIPKNFPYFPVPRKTDLNFLRPGSSEVLTRPVHVHEYMPPMILESEEKQPEEVSSALETQVKSDSVQGQEVTRTAAEEERKHDQVINGHISLVQNGLILEEPSLVPDVITECIVGGDPIQEVEVKTEEPVPEPIVNNDPEESSDDEIEPASSKVAALFATFKSTKKLESASENAALKRVRKIFEENGHPTREVTSVILTSSGYLSEAVEGRLPDSQPPPYRHFFARTSPPPEKRKKIPTMKKILEGVKKIDKRYSDADMDDEAPGLFGVPDKIKILPPPSSLIPASNDMDHGTLAVEENGELLPEPKKLSRLEKKVLSQKERKELRALKKQKLKKEKFSLKKSSLKIDQTKELIQSSSSKDKKNKLTIFTKKLKTHSINALTTKQLEKQRKREKKLRMKELRKPMIVPVEPELPQMSKSSTSAVATELIESDEDFSNVDHMGSLGMPPMQLQPGPHPKLMQGGIPKRKFKKEPMKLKSHAHLFDIKQQKKMIREKGLSIHPTMLPPIPKLSRAKLGKIGKRPMNAAGILQGDNLPLKKKRGRPKKIWDPVAQTPSGAPMPLPAAQLASIGKSLMIKEPTLKMEPPLKIMKIRKEHMEHVQDLGPPAPVFTTKPPSISPKPAVVSADLLKRLPAQPGLIPDVSPPPQMRLPKDLPASISITPAAISPAKESISSSRNFSGGLPPNVCSSVTITRIDMSNQQQKMSSPYDDPMPQQNIGPPPMLTERRSKLKGVPPPPPLQIPMQTETESGITITPIMMGNRFDIPPPPPLTERPQRAEKASMLAKLDEELNSSKEQRKKEKEKRKELKKEKKKKSKDKDRGEKKEKEKSDKKKKKKEKAESSGGEPPLAIVPKLTLKLSGHSNTPTPVDSPNPPQVFVGSDQDQGGPPKKITFKPMEEKKRTPSPDLHVARFSPLVTRPQKPVRAAKVHAAAACAAAAMGVSVNQQQEIISFPPVSRECSASGGGGDRGGNKRGRGRPPKGAAPTTPVPSSSSTKGVNKSSVTVLETETVGSIIDEQGNKIWICPTCGRQDDGSPMIGCDTCDDWYHFTCVGISEEPDEDTSWFCPRCLKKQKDGKMGKPKKKK